MRKFSNWRFNAVLAVILFFGAAVISRLFYIQILNHKFYQAQALGQQAGFLEVKGDRGQIFFANGKSLAINRDSYTIYAMPSEIENKKDFAKAVAEAIKDSEEDIFDKINGQTGYIAIKKGLDLKIISSLKKLKLKGLYSENTQVRFYPQETLAAKVAGFVGGEGLGQYGLEGFYNDELKGKNGIKEQKIGLDFTFSASVEGGLNGEDLYLTIDPNIQFEAENLLKETKKDLDIDSGQIVVLSPNSGKVLAMADFPSFNPNEYSKVDNMETFQNSAVQKLFEPGSVLKPFTMAIAINEGKITSDTEFFDQGYIKIGKDTIYNFAREKYGNQTMTETLEKSINTGAVFAEQKIPHSLFFNYMDKFGFNKKTGIDLQGEVASQNSLLKNGSDIEYATAAYGQGIEITPIQLAKAFSIFANDGKLAKPRVAEKNIEAKQEQVISEDTALKVTKMMISVLENGFAKSARVPGYYLAGKTGTAQVPLINGKGYDLNKTIQSFIGFGPAYNPKFLILVKLDNPKVSLSSLSSTPVFRKMAQYLINYWQIPPDYDANKK